MKVNRATADPLFSIGCQLFAFIWKFYEGKNRILVVGYSYLFCQYEISHTSQEKIIPNFLQNWEDDVQFIGNMTKTQNRDGNNLRWQKSTSLGIRVPGPECRKMEHRETLWWGCCCKKKRENHYVSRRWHPSFKGNKPPLTLAPLGGGPKGPPCGFSQIAPEVLGISLWNLPYLSGQQFHTLCQKIRTQVIIGQPWVTSEWRHVSPILINKMGLRESPPLMQF